MSLHRRRKSTLARQKQQPWRSTCSTHWCTISTICAVWPKRTPSSCLSYPCSRESVKVLAWMYHPHMCTRSHHTWPFYRESLWTALAAENGISAICTRDGCFVLVNDSETVHSHFSGPRLDIVQNRSFHNLRNLARFYDQFSRHYSGTLDILYAGGVIPKPRNSRLPLYFINNYSNRTRKSFHSVRNWGQFGIYLRLNQISLETRHQVWSNYATPS